METQRFDLLAGLIFWSCLGLSSATSEPAAATDFESGWSTGSLLKYNFYMLSAYPNETLEPYFNADLHLQPLSKDKLSITIHNAQERDLFVEEELHRNKTLPWVEPYFTNRSFNGEPFEVNLKNGLVTNLTVNKDVNESNLVIITTIASLLQLDFQSARCVTHGAPCQPPQETEVNKTLYWTNETSSHGVCETRYSVFKGLQKRANSSTLTPSVSHGNGPLFEVVKYIDYLNCQQNSTAEFKNKVAGLESFKSTSNMFISGDVRQYIIESIVSTVMKTLKPEVAKIAAGMEVVFMNLTLTSMEPATGQPSKVSNPHQVNLTQLCRECQIL